MCEQKPAFDHKEDDRMSDSDLLTKMGTDAVKWVDEYMARFANELPDEGNLLGWFANAIEAGRDAATLTPPGDDGCPCGDGR